MANKIYGYCRISTNKQNIERQVKNISENYPDALIIKEAFTGTKLERPEFSKILKKLNKGDTLVFDEVSRMSRNTQEGFELYQQLFNSGINLVFLKESHINTDSYKEALQGAIDVNINSGDSNTDELVNSIMKAINKFIMNKVKSDIFLAFKQAQKEVDYLHKRTSEGLSQAKLNGKQIGNKKGVKLTTKKSIEAKEQIKKYNKSFNGSLNDVDTIKLVGINKKTFYKYKAELLSELWKKAYSMWIGFNY